MKKIIVIILAVITFCGLLSQAMLHTVNTAPDYEKSHSKPQTLSITMSYEQKSKKDFAQEIANEFMRQNPEINVLLKFYPADDYWKYIYLNYSQRTLSDLIVMNNTMIPAFSKLGVLHDLSSYVEGNNLKGTMHPTLLEDTKQNGKYYGIPFMAYTYAIYCNMDLLNKYQCSVPKTWNEFWSVCEELSREPSDCFGIAAAPGEEFTNQFLQFLYSNNGNIRNLKDADATATYQLFADLVNQRMISKDSINWNQSDLTAKFASREVAMMIGNSSQVPVLNKLDPEFAWMVSGIPAGKERKSPISESTLFSCDSIVVKQSANLKAATEFIKYITTSEFVANKIDSIGGLQVRSDVTSRLFSKTGEYSLFPELLTTAIPFPSLVAWQNISQTVQGSVIDIFNKEKSIEQITQNSYRLVSEYIIDR